MNHVAIVRAAPEYPLPPFHPGDSFPEITGLGQSSRPVQGNGVYAALRESLRLMGLDEPRFGSSEWNPLRELVKPGGTVLIKPNLVTTSYRDDRLQCIVTHASVLRPIIDYALLAVGPSGRVLVGDCPERDMDLDLAFALNGMNSLLAHYRDSRHNVRFVDFRNQYAYYSPASSPLGRRLLAVAERTENPVKYRLIHLDGLSAFSGVPEKRLRRVYGAYYSRGETVRHHTNGHHTYELVQPFLDADLVVSVAKLKTHKKAGVTLTLKNFIGVNGNKNLLPHHTEGDPSTGGDAYAKPPATTRGRAARTFERAMHTMFLGTYQSAFTEAVSRKLIGLERRLVRPPEADVRFDSGGWIGNDTLWRTVTDVCRIAHYAGRDGRVERSRQRAFLGIVDGIVGGEGDGPKHAEPHPSGVIVAGCSLLAVDVVGASLMGLDPDKVRYLSALSQPHELDFSADRQNIQVVSNDEGLGDILTNPSRSLRYRPALTWEPLIRR